MHAPNAPVSSLQANVDPDSVEVNANVAPVAVVGLAGPDVIVVFGGVVSAGALIVQVCDGGVASTFPAVSIARTVNVCELTLNLL